LVTQYHFAIKELGLGEKADCRGEKVQDEHRISPYKWKFAQNEERKCQLRNIKEMKEELKFFQSYCSNCFRQESLMGAEIVLENLLG
jgi:hypothetical protein